MKTKITRSGIQLFVALIMLTMTAAGGMAGEDPVDGGSWMHPGSCTQEDEHLFDGEWRACTLQFTMDGGSTCVYSCEGIPATVFKFIQN